MDAEQADVSSTAVIAENVVERPEHVEVLRDFVELSETTSELRGTSNAIYRCSSGPEDALIPRPTHVVVEKQEGVLFRDARRPLFLLERQQSTRGSTRRSLKGPLRALRLCVLSILFPGLLVAVPLYMRYHVYSRPGVPCRHVGHEAGGQQGVNHVVPGRVPIHQTLSWDCKESDKRGHLKSIVYATPVDMSEFNRVRPGMD
uniref:Uncharacterized protein n=1 Tax=Timema cristinae TaxID=61476 RepID=A0A7R9CR61_TIMCR|nr:unnamed protein product [Timema cristinae]